jgi:hypothetical protein
MGSEARSSKEGAGPDRPHRATQVEGQTSSRKEQDRQGARSREQIAADKQEGQMERENAGKNR